MSFILPRAFFLVTAAGTALGLGLCFVPLFDLLGYEFSLALGLLAGPGAVAIGMGAGRQRPDGAAALVPATLLAVAALLPALGIITLNALRVKNCDYLDGIGFFVALPLGSALWGAALGVLLAQVLRPARRRLRLLAAVVVVLAPLAWTLAALFFEPPIFAFDHLFGHFAGSLYDEVVRLDARVWVFRLGTLLRVVAAAGVLWALGARPFRGPAPAYVAAAAGLLLVVAFETQLGPRFGFRVTRADILEALPAVEERPHLVIHLPRGLTPERRAEIADDHAFRLSQLLSALEAELPRPIHSFVYADAEQKARLMGGRDTMIAKPWLFEIHIHDAVAPHAILPHELAHAVAASFAPPPLHVASRGGVLVNMALVEGLAESVSPPRGELDLDAWSKALAELKLAPNLRRILGPAGFWSEAPRRAYTVAGSFVRYLLATYGAEPLKRAYADGDFDHAYPEPLDQLVADWERHLASVALSPRELAMAQEQFKTPSIFSRPCAHEIAQLREAAQRATPEEAPAFHRRICAHLGDDPAARFELAQAERRARLYDDFLRSSEALLAGPGLTAVQRTQLREARGETLWIRGDHAGALAELRAAEPTTDLAGQRLAWVRLWALERPVAAERDALRAFLMQEQNAVTTVLVLESGARAHPEDPTWHYLLGRHLARFEACTEAIPYLAAAHPLDLIEAERWRLLAGCYGKLGDRDRAREAWQRYRDLAPTSGERARAKDELERLAFLAGHARL